MAGETGTVESGLDTTAYNLAVYYALRPLVVFDAVATVKATKQSHRGASVIFTKMNDLNISTTPLDEYTDVAATALTDTPLTVTMTEYGRATISTAKLRATSFIEFDPTAANRLGYNAGRTIDLIAQTALTAEASSEFVTAVPGTTKITTNDIQDIKAQLENAVVRPFEDGFYRAYITPYMARDLRRETAAADLNNWRAPHTYQDTTQIYRGEIGEFEGFRFIVSQVISAGTEANTHRAVFCGQEALAKAMSSAPGFGAYPTVRPGPVTDKLWRFRPMGWYWLGGYKVFRPEAVIWADFNDVA